MASFCLSISQLGLLFDSWILDSGASSHVFQNLNYFLELQSVSGMSVSLCDGSRIIVEFMGNVCIN